jgi:hypothetical protein
VRGGLTGKIDSVRGDLTGKIDSVHADLTGKIDSVRGDLTGRIDALKDSLGSAKIWALVLYFGLAGAMLYTMARGFKWI